MKAGVKLLAISVQTSLLTDAARSTAGVSLLGIMVTIVNTGALAPSATIVNTGALAPSATSVNTGALAPSATIGNTGALAPCNDFWLPGASRRGPREVPEASWGRLGAS